MSEADSRTTVQPADSDGIRDFGTPFDATDADIILRSVDGVDFRAHRLILSLASAFFASMFSLPVPGEACGMPSLDAMKDGLFVVAMSEDARAIEQLLSYCYYPTQQPLVIPSTIEAALLLNQLAGKFELAVAADHAKAGLLALAKEAPERVYALGWILQSRDILSAGAKESVARSLSKSEGPLLDEYKTIPASAMYHLIAYQHRCLRRISTLESSMDWLDLSRFSSDAVPLSIPSGGCECGCQTVYRERHTYYVRIWILDYFEHARAELQGCFHPSTVKNFKSLKGLLSKGVTPCAPCREAAAPALEELSDAVAAYVEAILTAELDELYANTPF